ncbi:MAG: dTDP-4-dehydrorhamnose 3,5-epimerase [Oligoflexia bacterium]|nr:dTDP-4-dehydrorhamnose 3,5-epimerase [Oligoflexia bacterium]
MRLTPTSLPAIQLLRADVHTDSRGWLVETWHAARMAELGLPASFVQENRTLSHQGVLRGLHFQDRHPQAKLVSVVQGQIYDVAVDIRAGSPTIGQFVGLTLSDARPDLLFVPAGFAHGFYVTRGPAVVIYKLTAAYAPTDERCLAWDDPDLAIPWPLLGPPVLSARDRCGTPWGDLSPWHAPLDPADGQ